VPAAATAAAPTAVTNSSVRRGRELRRRCAPRRDVVLAAPSGPYQLGTDLYRVVIRLRPDQCGVVPRLPELQAAVPHGRADLGFGPRRDHFARSSAHSSSTSFRGRRDGERGRAPPEPPGPPAPRAATPLHCVEAGLPQSLSSRHAVRASLARTSPVGSVSSMPKVFPIWSSRRATLLWCRWSRSAAWRWEPVTQ
jgi:hypothetical protein